MSAILLLLLFVFSIGVLVIEMFMLIYNAGRKCGFRKACKVFEDSLNQAADRLDAMLKREHDIPEGEKFIRFPNDKDTRH